ncbi:unnamed protein product, partial [Staurois parvus]
MALGRKGLTCGMINGLTVCCFTRGCVCVLHCKHTAFHGCAQHSHAKQCGKRFKKQFSLSEILG